MQLTKEFITNLPELVKQQKESYKSRLMTFMVDSINEDVSSVSDNAGSESHLSLITKALKAPFTYLAYGKEGLYSGEVYALFKCDLAYVLISDYFGSCGGCDSIEGATFEDLSKYRSACVRSAKVFLSKEELLEHIKGTNAGKHYDDFNDSMLDGFTAKDLKDCYKLFYKSADKTYLLTTL